MLSLTDKQTTNIFTFMWIIFSYISFSLITSAYAVGISRFSLDSWTYFELSKTIFSKDFYIFNTFRSYFSESRSAAFPFGYPILVAIVHFLFGDHPTVAVYLNVLIAILTWLFIIKTAETHNITNIGALLIAASLIFYSRYLDEILGGRAMPLAILLFICGVYILSKGNTFTGAFLVGLSATVRFDYLLYGLVMLIGYLLVRKRGSTIGALTISGFILGASPWIIFSWFYFGKIWVSDNSWVAFSAVPVFVLDYPATATLSVFDDPVAWLTKVFGNILPLSESIVKGLMRYPTIITLGYVFFRNFKKYDRHTKRSFILIIFFCVIYLFQNVATGYDDQRYFSLMFLFLTASLVILFEKMSTNSLDFADRYRFVYSIALCSTLLVGSYYLARDSWLSITSLGGDQHVQLLIQKLEECHRKNPEVAYIFKGEAGFLTARYGAQTGLKTAFIPSNFDRMNELEKTEYFQFISPYRIIQNLQEGDGCVNEIQSPHRAE